LYFLYRIGLFILREKYRKFTASFNGAAGWLSHGGQRSAFSGLFIAVYDLCFNVLYLPIHKKPQEICFSK
jgi:hypothetical protein